MSATESKFDAVSLEILWSRLISIADEMALTLMRTAFSSVVREARDFACALFDAEGQMIAQSASSTAGLTGSTLVSVKNVCSVFDPDRLLPGDVLITNDPWLCTGHLLDTTIVTPIFLDNERVGFAVTVVHLMDIGGRASPLESSEIYEEGLWLPVMYFHRQHQVNQDVIELIKHNVRVSDLVVGDINAQVLAANLGVQRVAELMREAGLSTLTDLSTEIIDRTEADMRQSISQIPDGVYTDETWIDGFDEPLVIRTAIEIANTSLTIDFTGTSAQIKRGINSVANMTRSFTFLGVKCAVNPYPPNNEGILRPVTITSPPGTIVNATHPAPVVGRSHVAHYLPYCVFGALSKAQPERAMAASSHPIWSQRFAGVWKGGRPFLATQMISGGLGARATKDGISALSYPGNVSNVPVEVLESDAPVLVEEKSVRIDSGGPGKYRGGCGQDFRIRVLPFDDPTSEIPEMLCANRADRLMIPAPGLEGGQPGEIGRVIKNDGEPVHGKKATILHPGDTVLWSLPGGGGFYDPLTRDIAAVGSDVQDGFVSVEGALRDYRVVVDPYTMTVDEERTRRCRQEMASNAPAELEGVAP